MNPKLTATWYCSKKGGKVGSVDNPLEIGDVAIKNYGPSKRKVVNAKEHILQAQFNYIKFLNKIYRVADQCDISNNVDIYQGNAQACINAGKCICSKQSPLPGRNQQNGGYEVVFLEPKIQSYKEYGH